MVEKEIRDLLLGDMDVTGLVAEGNIRLHDLPQNAELPGIVIEIDDQEPVQTMGAKHENADSIVILTCYGNTYSEARNLAQVVRQCLDSQVSSITGGQLVIICKSMRHDFEPAIGSEFKQRYLVEIELNIFHPI